MKAAPLCAWLALFSVNAAAQDTRPDTVALGAVVVVAERSPTPINRSTAAVTRLTAADLARTPDATLADVLRMVPGFAVVNFDGLGRDPQLMARGFYGGGEADYVTVLVDGRPVSLVHNGTIAWELLPPLQQIESVEIVRGSASSLHGDAAVGGVVNIVTRRPEEPEPTWQMQAGSFAGLAGSIEVPNALRMDNSVSSFAVDRTDGYRNHSARTALTASASAELRPGSTLTFREAWRHFDAPGPLRESMVVNGTESDPMFQNDGGEDNEFGAAFDHVRLLGTGGALRTSFRLATRHARLTRTLALAPDFGDTRERRLNSTTGGLTIQADHGQGRVPGVERLTVGASVDLGTIDSRYFSGAGNARALDAEGDGHRLMSSVFAHLASNPAGVVRWTLGLRLDHLADAFTPATGDDYSASHLAVSPKAGVNVRYAPAGHLWVAASRTFKAPTLDQLFDQRPIPIPFPPFTLTTSNPDLDPQRGTSVEAGVYHDATLGTSRMSATLTLYQIAMTDELDFDLQTFKYVNLAESRHRGAEAGLTLSGSNASVFASLTLQDAVARAGDNAGKQLKAIPGQLVAAGVTVSPAGSGTLTLTVSRMADMFIDDANTRRIPSWTRVDAQASRTMGFVDFVLGVRNVLNARFNSTGYLDPAGSGEAYWYPAAGRVITLGIRNGR